VKMHLKILSEFHLTRTVQRPLLDMYIISSSYYRFTRISIDKMVHGDNEHFIFDIIDGELIIN